MKKRGLHRGSLLLASAVLVIGLGTSVAYATGAISNGSSNPSYTACVKTQNGQLRIVSAASQCLPSEYAIQIAQPVPPPGPQNVTVDCGSGQSIQQTIDQADPTQPLNITILGTCDEMVTINRDNVSLSAGSPGAGISAPAGSSAALSLNDARGINLKQLTLAGGQNTLNAYNNSDFGAYQLNVSGGTGADVSVDLGSSGELNDATITNAAQSGVVAGNGGSISLDGGTVSGSGTDGVSAVGGDIAMSGVVVSDSGLTGVYAAVSSAVVIRGSTVEGGGVGVRAATGGSISINSGTLIQNNTLQGVAVDNGSSAALTGAQVSGNAQDGIIVFGTGSLQLQNSMVQNNAGNGVTLSLGSTGQFQDDTISNNAHDGIHLNDSSVAQFNYPTGNDTVTGNGGWGVTCETSPADAMIGGVIGTVSGNGAGQVSCPSF
ncbi:MAG TPA: right-handed parallel beta-helix repeat-containing protein [Acidimicrobiales bacterium]|nr:right-handed parallel beta-helix repeat-containing protein [Acidimicrobiales bacterium]